MNSLYMCETTLNVLIEFFHYLFRRPFTTLDNCTFFLFVIDVKNQNVQHMRYSLLIFQTHSF